MVRYLHQDIGEIPEPFDIECHVIYEQALDEQVRMVFEEIILRNSVYAWRVRGIFNLTKTGERWSISSLHFSESAVSQGEEEHYPRTLVVENITGQRMIHWLEG